MYEQAQVFVSLYSWVLLIGDWVCLTFHSDHIHYHKYLFQSLVRYKQVRLFAIDFQSILLIAHYSFYLQAGWRPCLYSFGFMYPRGIYNKSVNWSFSCMYRAFDCWYSTLTGTHCHALVCMQLAALLADRLGIECHCFEVVVPTQLNRFITSRLESYNSLFMSCSNTCWYGYDFSTFALRWARSMEVLWFGYFQLFIYWVGSM